MKIKNKLNLDELLYFGLKHFHQDLFHKTFFFVIYN